MSLMDLKIFELITSKGLKDEPHPNEYFHHFTFFI